MALTHRVFTIPATIAGLAALALGLVAGVLSLPTDISPWSLAGAGLALVVLCVGLAELLDRAPAPAPARAAPVGVVAAVAVALLLALGIGAGAVFSPAAADATVNTESTGAPGGDAAAIAEGLLGEDSFDGTLEGVSGVPLVGGVGATGSPEATFDLDVPAGAEAYRIELTLAAGTGAATEALVVLEAEEDGAWVEVASATGGDGTSFDARDLPEGDLRLRITLPDGSASAPTDFTLYASAFSGAIPADHSALGGHGHQA